MTLEDYISNPMGKNNATFTPLVREAIKNNYKAKFDNVMLREKGKMGYYLYRDRDNNIYYAHLKVPSEVIENFYYDVVFKFYTSSDNDTAGGTNLKKFDIQFFSNDPAFVYNHAHTFMEKGLFLNELEFKMSKEAIQKKAVVKNPNDSVGYVKSLYFAYLYMEERGLYKTISYISAEKFNLMNMASQIMGADLKIALREEEEKKRDKKKKLVVDKDLAKKLGKYNLSDKAKSRLVTTTGKTSTIKKTSAINSTKTTKRVGKK